MRVKREEAVSEGEDEREGGWVLRARERAPRARGVTRGANERAGKRESARARMQRAQPTPGKTAHHICQPLGCENISSVDKPVEDARGLQYLVDALRRVGQLLLCVRQREEHVSLRVRVLQACALLPGSQPPPC